ALAYTGRLTAFERSESTRPVAQIVNLNAVADPGQLEPAMATAFANASDRRLAAQELFRFLNDQRNRGSALPNVGAIAHATVSAAAIERSGKLQVFAERLRVLTANAASAGRASPAAVPLLTSADLASVKPQMSVRTREELRRQVLLFGLLSALGFYVVVVVWRLRGIQGDVLLLAIAHMLTAVGFSVLLGRPDPLRDSLLFVRYAEGILVGLGLMACISLIDFSAAGFVELS